MAEYGYSGQGFSNGHNLPAYKQPKYDQGQIGLYTQQQMAPGLARLRRGFQSSVGGYTDNPAERDRMLREAMAGYGQGLGELQAGATNAAQGLYAQQYAGLEKQAGMDYETAMQNWQLKQLAEQKKKDLQDPRGRVLPTYSSWADYDAEVARSRPIGTTYQTTQGYAPKTSSGSPQAGLYGYASSNTTPMGYGAGSEEAYRRAMAQGELAQGLYGGSINGKTGYFTGTPTNNSLSDIEKALRGPSGSFNPYAGG